MAIVSTGQLTIVDNNDARPLSAYISANPGTQQIYTKDESVVSFVPDWTTINSNVGLQLKARVFAGGATAPEEVTGALSNKKWSFSAGGATIVTGSAPTTDFETGGTLTVTNDSTQAMLTIKANLKVGGAPEQVFFEGDYTDPITGLVSRIVSTITLTQVKTGTNAVYINLRAPDGNILEPNANKTQVRVYADLIRAAGVDDTGTGYRWYQTPHAASDQIDGNLPSVTSKYGALTTAQVNASAAGVIGQYNGAAITTSNMPDAAFIDAKGLVIHHSAVTDIQVFKVEARDADGTIYQQYFTVYDVSDPYDVVLISTAGEKLQNGVGNTDVYPTVYYGAARQTNTSGFTYNWYFYDRNGQRAAFVDATRTALAGGRQITANTTTTFTYSGTAITFAAGEIIKANVGGIAKYYEVASATGNTVTIRAPTTNTWLTNNSATLVANAAVNGYLFVCVGMRTTTGTSGPDTDSKISLSGDDIDAKGVILVEANK
jgi:hypothetical protein